MRELSDHEIDAVAGAAGGGTMIFGRPDALRLTIDWSSLPRIGGSIFGPLISPTVPVVEPGRGAPAVTGGFPPVYPFPGDPGGFSPDGGAMDDERAGGS